MEIRFEKRERLQIQSGGKLKGKISGENRKLKGYHHSKAIFARPKRVRRKT